MQTQGRSFQPVRTRRVFEEICEQIRRRLDSGELKPGDKLPAERDLVLEMGVSRPALREALRTLEISGLITLRKGVKGGAFICDGSPARLTQSLQDLMFLGRLSLVNLMEARGLISGVVIRLACERGTERHFDAIQGCIEYIEKCEDLKSRSEAAVSFFSLIAQATGNEVLALLVDSLSDIVRHVNDRSGRVARPELLPVRRLILKHLRARNVTAASRAVNDYLDIVHKSLLEHAAVKVPLSVPTDVKSAKTEQTAKRRIRSAAKA